MIKKILTMAGRYYTYDLFLRKNGLRVLMSISLVVSLSSTTLSAQKVGLVLSGGGAKGIAHIGMLRALEENNIPIDYITGTSMGAIIGGLYAAGFSLEEIKTFFKSELFTQWATNEKKIEDNEILGEFKPHWLKASFSFDSSFSLLPNSFRTQTEIEFLLMSAFLSPSSLSAKHFDSLYVPFRCVAINLDKKKEYIFKKGSLTTAIKASMAIPILFRPVEYDTVLLFDGGLYNNFPVDVMRTDFNPELIIGHQVSRESPPATKGDLMSQIFALIERPTVYEIDSLEGLLIKSIPDISILDFGGIEDIEQFGYNMTMENMEEIKRRVKRRTTPKERHAARERFKEKLPPLVFDEVTVTGLPQYASRYISRKLLKNGSADINRVQKLYLWLSKDLRVKDVRVRGELKPNKKYHLYLSVDMRQPFTFFLGGNLSTLYTNQFYVGVTYAPLSQRSILGHLEAYIGNSYTAYEAAVSGRLTSNDMLRLRLQFGLNSRTYQEKDLLRNIKAVTYTSEEIERFIKINLIIQTRNAFSLRGGATWGKMIYEYPALNIDTENNYLDFHLNLRRNTLNKRQFHTKGSFRNLSGRIINEKPYNHDLETSNQPFSFALNYETRNYFSLWKSFVVGYNAEALYSVRNVSEHAFLKQYTPMPQWRLLYIKDYRSPIYLAGGAEAIIRLFPQLDLRIGTNTFVNFQSEWPLSEELITTLSLNGSLALVYDAGMLPVSLTLDLIEGLENLFIALNVGYILFNKGIAN